MKQEIVKIKDFVKEKNTHYKAIAYSQFCDLVIIYGISPVLDIDTGEIINPGSFWYSWKAFLNGKFYGDFVTSSESETHNDDILKILKDQAERSLGIILKNHEENR